MAVATDDDTGVRAPRTSLVGREAELEAVSAALGASRLVTVTGLGGTGKTRLAVEVVRRVGPTFTQGSRTLDVTPVGSLDGMVAALWKVLAPASAPPGGASIARLVAAHSDDLLLLLDNCEHALDHVAPVVDHLLEGCPQLTILATSREPLRLPGESVVALDPLPVTPSSSDRPSPAVRLFADRARAVRHGFRLDAANADEIVAICQFVDGIPLAIELAAAHLGHMSTAEVRRELEVRPSSLASRDRTAVARHRTLTATLDWSYRLLSPAEQDVLGGMSVFLSGASADAIAAVCAGEVGDVRGLIASLVEKSLVLVEERAEASRYRLLDTVRRYVLQRLEASGELDLVRRRQAQWLVGRWRTDRSVDDRVASSAAAADDLSDLIATLTWARDAGDAELALALAGASLTVWEVAGRHGEGRRLLTEVLALVEPTAPSVEAARVRMAAAQLAFVAGDLPAARSDYEQAIGELGELGADAEEAAALHSLAMVRLFEGATDEARELAVAALARFQGFDDEGGAAFAHTSLALVDAHSQRPDEAERHFLDALRGFRRLGLKREAASVLDNLGNLAADLGQTGRAHRYYEGALQLQQQVGDDRGAALSLNCLCLIAQQRGNLDRAWEYAEAARRLFHGIGDRAGEAATVNNLANLTDERGQPAHAMELYGECIRAFREMGDPRRLATALKNLADLARRVDERQLAWDCLIDAALLWHRLGKTSRLHEALTELREVGMAWGIADGVRWPALDDADPVPIGQLIEEARWVSIPAPSTKERPSAKATLTAREQQVVGLVARGLTNAEIAGELFISERTVESHVSSARSKLGLDSRTKLTRWVLEQDAVG